MNRASPISDIDEMDLPKLLYYGKLWEMKQKMEKSEAEKLKTAGK